MGTPAISGGQSQSPPPPNTDNRVKPCGEENEVPRRGQRNSTTRPPLPVSAPRQARSDGMPIE
jgi:hypothetical protein